MTDSPRLVLDASIILKWVLDADDEDHWEAARDILDGWKEGTIELLVPPLWIYEVGNFLCRRKPREAEQILTALRGLGLTEITSAPLLAETVALAVDYRVTFYDAAYLAVARLHQATLVTADARFLRKLPPGTPARLLGDLETRSR